MRDSKHADSSSAIHRQRNKHSNYRAILSGLGLFLFVFFLIYGSIFVMMPAILSSARVLPCDHAVGAAGSTDARTAREAESATKADRLQSTVRVLPCDHAVGTAASGPAVTTKNLEIILLSSYSETMKSGESRTISASTPGGIPVTWESSNPKIVAVSSSGIITARKKGTAMITARTENAYAACKVRVKKATKRR